MKEAPTHIRDHVLIDSVRPGEPASFFTAYDIDRRSPITKPLLPLDLRVDDWRARPAFGTNMRGIPGQIPQGHRKTIIALHLAGGSGFLELCRGRETLFRGEVDGVRPHPLPSAVVLVDFENYFAQITANIKASGSLSLLLVGPLDLPPVSSRWSLHDAEELRRRLIWAELPSGRVSPTGSLILTDNDEKSLEATERAIRRSRVYRTFQHVPLERELVSGDLVQFTGDTP